MNTRPLLLFDLGGVLIEFSGPHDIHALLREPVSAEEAARLFAANDAIAEFEVGRTSPEEFAAAFCAALPLNCSPGAFLQHYQSWTRAILPGAAELLSELQATYRLAALSNSNLLHWTLSEPVVAIQTYFERAFSSHLLGVRKPDPEMFMRALAELKVAPPEVVFFDDNAVNAEAARSLGIDAYRVEGPQEVRRRLVELSLL